MPEFHSFEGFSVEKSYYYQECPEIDRFLIKAYYYTMDISVNELALLELKKYLTENTEAGSEVELWSIWLGGDFTKHYLSMPKISNIPTKALKEIEDSIDAYAEDHFNPEIRKTRICELCINDISFIDKYTGACLIMCH